MIREGHAQGAPTLRQAAAPPRLLHVFGAEFCAAHGYPHALVAGEDRMFVLLHRNQRESRILACSPDFSERRLILDGEGVMSMAWDGVEGRLLLLDTDMFLAKNKRWNEACASDRNRVRAVDAEGRALPAPRLPALGLALEAAVGRNLLAFFDACGQRLVLCDRSGRVRGERPLGRRFLRGLRLVDEDAGLLAFLGATANQGGPDPFNRVCLSGPGGVGILFTDHAMQPTEYAYDLLPHGGGLLFSTSRHLLRLDLSGRVAGRTATEALLRAETAEAPGGFASLCGWGGVAHGMVLNASATEGRVYALGSEAGARAGFSPRREAA